MEYFFDLIYDKVEMKTSVQCGWMIPKLKFTYKKPALKREPVAKSGNRSRLFFYMTFATSDGTFL